MQLIVLAMHRSGTSAVTRLINMMGAYVGAEGTSTGANTENPKGFWERRDVRQVNDGLLFAAGAAWHRIARFELDNIPEQKRKSYETEARRIVLELDAHRPWVFKEPRFCLLLPFWLDLLDSPVIVHVQRSPIQIAQSLQRRNGFPLHVGLALWERYTFDALRHSTHTPGIVVQHQELIADPVAVVKRMHHDLQELGVTGLRLPDEREIRAFVEPSLHRQRGDDTLQRQVMNERQRSLEHIIQKPITEALSVISEYQLSHGGKEALLSFERGLGYEEALSAERRKVDAASRDLRRFERGLSKVLGEAGYVHRSTQVSPPAPGQLDSLDPLSAVVDLLGADLASVTAMGKQLAEEQAQSKALAAELKTLKSELNTLTSERNTLKSQLNTLKPELNTLKSERNTLKSQLNTLKPELNTLKSERNTLKSERNTLKREVSKLSASGRKILGTIQERAKKAQKLVGDIRRSRRWRLGSAVLGGVRGILGRDPETALDGLDRVLADLQAKAAKLPLTVASESVAITGAKQKPSKEAHGQAGSTRSGAEHGRRRNKSARTAEDTDPTEQIEAIERLADVSEALVKDTVHSWPWRVGDVVVGVLTETGWRERPPRVVLDLLAIKIREMEAGAKAAVDTTLQTPEERETTADIADARIDVIVCVHNALDDVRRCLQSVINNSPRLNRLILVDDASAAETRDFLRSIAEQTPNTLLVRDEEAGGYTKAANLGLLSSTADFAVLLNSDTIVSRGWLERLWRCFAEDDSVGIVGPLSNAASWQSVPEQRNADGDWAINTLPENVPVSAMAKLVATQSRYTRPPVPILNGFCLMISRRVVNAVGLLDEQAFPRGYGEENDFCIRAEAAGFRLVLADDAYVYHAKSKSYSHAGRKALAKAGRAALDKKYGPDTVPRLSAELANSQELGEVRTRIASALSAKPLAAAPLRMLYLLPVRPGGGGVHSVVQEAQGLRSLGVETQIAIPDKKLDQFLAAYPKAFHGIFSRYTSTEQLLELAEAQDVVVATIFSSVAIMSRILEEHPHVMPAYYIQDYEPWICGQDTSARAAAAQSYDAIPGMLRFAKTDWICKMVRERHAVDVHRVIASVDHSVYFPPQQTLTSQNQEPVRLCAMIRPRTPRRGAPMTMRVLEQLAERFGDGIGIAIFGCATDEVERAGLKSGFPYQNHGVLAREQVAEVLRASDIFLDLSTYQAFGRTALEAMACRCAVVVPRLGGADEYAIDNVNARVVDSANESEILTVLAEMVEDREHRARLSDAGCKTAAKYTIDAACESIKAVVEQAVARSNVIPEKPRHHSGGSRGPA